MSSPVFYIDPALIGRGTDNIGPLHAGVVPGSMTFDGAQVVMPQPRGVAGAISRCLGLAAVGISTKIEKVKRAISARSRPIVVGAVFAAGVGALMPGVLNPRMVAQGAQPALVPSADLPMAASTLPLVEATPVAEVSGESFCKPVSAVLGGLPQPVPAAVQGAPAADLAAAPRISKAEMEAVAACLIKEAGGEGRVGMQAVMNVIMNRALRRPENFFPVIEQPWHFSCFNDLRDRTPGGGFAQVAGECKRRPQWQTALHLVEEALKGQLPDITGGANHYYNPQVASPKWAADSRYRATTSDIGRHRFMRGPSSWSHVLKLKTVAQRQAPEHTAGPEVAQ